MAVEIRELVIKATIVDEQDDNRSENTVSSVADKEEIIQECVNQVLKIIKKSNNR